MLQALLPRRILTTHITAQGYGETVPIADNQTEDRREANRRIEFKLIEPETPAAEDTTDTSESADEQN